jgi:hypothetical protein
MSEAATWINSAGRGSRHRGQQGSIERRADFATTGLPDEPERKIATEERQRQGRSDGMPAEAFVLAKVLRAVPEEVALLQTLPPEISA